MHIFEIDGRDQAKSSLAEMREQTVADIVPHKSLVTFLLFTGIIYAGDESMNLLIQETYGKSKRTSAIISFVACAWFYLLRILTLQSFIWSIFRFIDYYTANHCGSHFAMHCFRDYFTAGCIALQSISVIPCCNHLRKKIFEDKFKAVNDSALWVKFLSKGWWFLLFSVVTSTPYAIYRLNLTELSASIRMSYVLLFVGQLFTSIMLCPVLLYFLTNIESTKILITSVEQDVIYDRLTASIYIKIENIIQKRQNRDKFFNQLFFGVNILNVLCILLNLARPHYGPIVLEQSFFCLQYFKETLLTVVVVAGASRANTMSDKSIELMTSSLLNRCCLEGQQESRKGERETPIVKVNNVMNPALQDIDPTLLKSPTPIAAPSSTHDEDFIPEPTCDDSNESDGYVVPEMCEACKELGTCAKCHSLSTAVDNASSVSNGINGVNNTTLYMNIPVNVGEEINKLGSYVDSLAICMASASKPISFYLCGLRITEFRAKYVLVSYTVSLAFLMIRYYGALNPSNR